MSIKGEFWPDGLTWIDTLFSRGQSDRLSSMMTKEEAQRVAESLGLVWTQGVETLYKFKGFEGDQKSHVYDILENSRIFFAEPGQFNDPFDSAPVIRLAGDPKNKDFVEELRAEEDLYLAARGMSESQVEKFRKEHGTDVIDLANESMTMIRDELARNSRILCLSAEQCHPLQWAHYADSHKGVCLHFSCPARITVRIGA